MSNNSRLDYNARKMKELTEALQFSLLIHEPTRITNTSQTLIDLVLTNSPNFIRKAGVIHLDVSDHSLVFAVRKLSVAPTKLGHKYITKRNMKKFNDQRFINDLRQISWIEDEAANPNILSADWKHKFIKVLDSHAPLKTKRVRHNNAPWLSAEVKQHIYDKMHAKKRAIRTGLESDWKDYKRFRNRLNNKIKFAKSNYYKEKIKSDNGDSRSIWKTINQVLNRKTKSYGIKEIEVDQTSVTDQGEIANMFNKHFISVGPKLSADLPQSKHHFKDFFSKETNNFEFKFKRINEDTVLNMLQKIDITKATGLDGVSPYLLKIAAPVIANSLTTIFNRIIETGVFPDQWKTSKVLPLFKKDDRKDMSNYRPISILSSISKLFEKILYNQLYAYFEDNNQLNKNQSGFRARHSTMTALIDATNHWLMNIDKGDITSVVFLDIAKAFDCIDHNILLHKLSLYGIKNNELKLLKSYLSDRTQYCCVGNNTSDPE